MPAALPIKDKADEDPQPSPGVKNEITNKVHQALAKKAVKKRPAFNPGSNIDGEDGDEDAEMQPKKKTSSASFAGVSAECLQIMGAFPDLFTPEFIRSKDLKCYTSVVYHRVAKYMGKEQGKSAYGFARDKWHEVNG